MSVEDMDTMTRTWDGRREGGRDGDGEGVE